MKKYHNTHELFEHYEHLEAESKADYVEKFTKMFKELANKEYWVMFIHGGPNMNGYVLKRTKELAKIFESTVEEELVLQKK